MYITTIITTFWSFVNLFNINNYLYINTNINTETLSSEEVQLRSLISLKKIIYESGSLYIKFFQWYISKLKSNIINTDNPETIITTNLITYFDDIFEQCPYHSIEHTKTTFKKSMNSNTSCLAYSKPAISSKVILDLFLLFA